MKSFVCSTAVVICAALFPPFNVHGAERVALVIGNDKYPAAPLSTACTDANAIAEMLSTRLGFDHVIGGKMPGLGEPANNLDKAAFSKKLEEFITASAGAKLMLFYYAGHGMENSSGSDNFMLPTDTKVNELLGDEPLAQQGLSLSQLLQKTEKLPAAKVFILDACRNRPEGAKLTPGFAKIVDDQLTDDSLVMLAAAPRRLALDAGPGIGHSPLAGALLNEMPVPNSNILMTLLSASDRAIEYSAGAQTPWVKFSGNGRYFRDNSLATVTDLLKSSRQQPFVNELGMKFIPYVQYQGDGETTLYMCMHETRMRDYFAYIAATPARHKAQPRFWSDPKVTPNHPINCVTMDEALSFCHWLTITYGRRAGLIYRLPDVEEWMAATGCSAEFNTIQDQKLEVKYAWGKQWPPPSGIENFAGEELLGTTAWPDAVLKGYRDDSIGEAPVMMYKPNAQGFYDMGGNVSEFCLGGMGEAKTGNVFQMGLGALSFHSEKSLRLGAYGQTESFTSGPGLGFRVFVESAAGIPTERLGRIHSLLYELQKELEHEPSSSPSSSQVAGKPASFARPTDIPDFLKAFIAAGESGSSVNEIDFFAERVDRYFDQKSPTRESILKEMAAYNKQWPQRDYQIQGRGIPIGNQIGEDTWEVKPLEIYFSVTNGAKHREGITKTRMVIKLINGKLAITSVEAIKQK